MGALEWMEIAQDPRKWSVPRRTCPEKRSIGSDFSATRQDLGKRRKTYLANVLNFMLASL